MIEDDPLLLTCSSCQLTGTVPVDDPACLRDVARQVFLTHADATPASSSTGPS